MRAFFSGLFQFIIVSGTALVVLLAGEGVDHFVDVTETQYAVAVLGGLIASAKDIQSRLALPRRQLTQETINA